MTAPPPDPLDAPFDQFQRYTIAASVARTLAAAGPIRVLDVGGHHLDFWGRPRRPMAEFLPELPSISIDLPANPQPGYVRAGGDAIPFAAGTFDLVCSVDVLEHVPAPSRPLVLDHAMRVSSRAVLLAAPFRSHVVEAAEGLVFRFIREVCGYEQGQLREHRELGWPSLADTVQRFAEAGWTARVFGYGNIWRWTLMMIDKHAVSALMGSRLVQTRLDRAYNHESFADDTAPPHYRTFVLATSSADDPVLGWAAERYGAMPVDAWLRQPAEDPAVTARQLRMLEIHAANQTIQVRLEPERRTAHIRDVEAHRDQAFEVLRHLESENARLAALLRDVERSTTFRLASWARRLLRLP
ncbi:MAG TPA: class I SAM-dependent methyltransferase [Vicinamibacterales bacterium]